MEKVKKLEAQAEWDKKRRAARNGICPDCGFIPLIKKVVRRGTEYWVYECACSIAVVERRAWEKTAEARARFADVLYGEDGLRMSKSELSNEDIVELYRTALEVVVE
jgi:hypothetical protein